MDKLRVLHILLGGTPRYRRYVTQLVLAIGRLEDAPAAMALCDENPALERRAQAIRMPVELMPPPEGYLAARAAAAQARLAARTFAPHLVHAHGLHAAYPAAAAAREALRAGTPCTLLVSSERPDLSGPWWARRALRCARCIGLISAPQPGQTAPAEIVHIEPGLDPRDFGGGIDLGIVMSELQLNPYTLHFGMVADLEDESCGAELFLAAAEQVLKRIPEVEFAIAGEGPLRPELEQRAHAAGILGSVRFVGARADIERFYAAMDVLVVPSLSTAFPWALAEGLAAQVHILASDLPEHRAVVPPQANVEFLPPGDVSALARRILEIVRTPMDDDTEYAEVDAQSPTGPTLARIEGSFKAYEISGDELVEIEPEGEKASPRREVLRRFNIARAAADHVSLYRRLVGQP